jgi:hypothetical protein
VRWARVAASTNMLHGARLPGSRRSRGSNVCAVPHGEREPTFQMTSTLSEANAFHPPGFASRRAAANLLEAVLRRNRPLDEQLDDRHPNPSLRAIDERDRALARRIVATVL